MTDDHQIELRNVSKRFGSVRALDDVSLNINRGEFFALLGASGCGKTTLLRVLAGFENPSDGDVFIDGESMTAVPPYRRPTNMVFQNYAMFPHLNVYWNIAYGLRKERLSREDLRARVEEALAMIKMEGYGERNVGELSGGQQQRVALARALVKHPKVLLLDEPLGALDKKLREQMQVELRSLQQKVGITFVFVTHDQEEALTMSDRIAIMSGGRILQVDTPSVLYDAPNCREVAEFVGNMNFFEGRVAGMEGDELLVDTASGAGVIRAGNPGFRPIDGTPLTLAIRPEKVALSADQPEDESAHTVGGSLINMAYFGNRVTCFVEIPGKTEPVTVVIPNVERFANASFEAGQKVWLSFAARSIVVLPEAEEHAGSADAETVRENRVEHGPGDSRNPGGASHEWRIKQAKDRKVRHGSIG